MYLLFFNKKNYAMENLSSLVSKILQGGRLIDYDLGT